MGTPGITADVKSSGLACDIWSTEWTFAAACACTLDVGGGDGGAWTDLDPRVPEATQVVGTTGGIVDIKFPKSKRARVSHVSIEPATPATVGNHRQVTVTALNAVAGTCRLFIAAANGGTLSDPQVGSRGRLVLELEYR